MNKPASIAVGVIVVAGVLATAGAWYTGTRLEGVLRTSIQDANTQIQTSLAGSDASMSVELVSLDRHLFTSTAHYRVDVQSKDLANNDKVEFLVVDNIEHGPLPWSRLKSLKLLPVMATSNYELEKSPSSEKWFAMTKGVTPLKGHVSLGYDRATQGTLELQPLDFEDKDGAFKFSGLNVEVDASADAEKIKATGNLDNLQLHVVSQEGPVNLEIKGMTFDSGGTKGKSGFYLGHSDVKFDNVLLQVVGKPALQFKNFVNTNLAQEEGGNLAAQSNYNVGMMSYDGKDVGALEMGLKFNNFDVVSTRALYELLQTTILPQQQAAAQAGVPFKPKLSPAEQAVFESQSIKLLAARPHIELEKLALRTANGESTFSLAVDLANPGSLDLPAPDLWKKILGQLDAKLQLSKPMISDLATLQATLAGQTDAQVIAQQSKDASDTVGGMAVMLQLAKIEGDNIVSNLHYANDIVDFNDQKMTTQQFIALIMGKVGGLTGQ